MFIKKKEEQNKRQTDRVTDIPRTVWMDQTVSLMKSHMVIELYSLRAMRMCPDSSWLCWSVQIIFYFAQIQQEKLAGRDCVLLSHTWWVFPGSMHQLCSFSQQNLGLQSTLLLGGSLQRDALPVSRKGQDKSVFQGCSSASTMWRRHDCQDEWDW